MVADGHVDEWAALDLLGSLIDKSLVQALPGDEPRYRLLESARMYALERLADAGEADAIRRRLAQAVAALFDRADADYLGAPSLQWAEQLAPDLDNLRAALNWALGPDGDADCAVALGGCTGSFWLAAGLATEGARFLERIVPLIGTSTPARSEARLRLALGTLSAVWAVPVERAREAIGRALEISRRLGERELTYRALAYHIMLAGRVGMSLDEEALLQEMRSCEGDDWSALKRRMRRWAEAGRLHRCGQWDEYRDALRREVALLKSAGDTRAVWLMSHNLAMAEIVLGQSQSAAEVMGQVVAEIRARGPTRQYWMHIAILALARIEQEDPALAAPAVQAALKEMRVEGVMWWLGDHLPWFVAQRGGTADAARLRGRTAARLEARGERRDVDRGNARARLVSLLQEQLGDGDRVRLEAEGAGLSDDEAAVIVLGA